MTPTTLCPRSESATPRRSDRIRQVNVDGVWIDALTENECIAHILTALEEGVGGYVVTPNLDHLRRYRVDSDFRSLVDQANLVVADGMPLVWASRLQGTPLPQRVAGSSLIHTLSAAAAEAGRSIYLLGGNPGTAEAAASVLQQRYVGLNVAGTCCPQLGTTFDHDALTALRARLEACRPDIVFVGLGSPKQERLIQTLRSTLPHAWWLGVGISFSFVCGDVARAPRWLQRVGLEWAFRLWQEPMRLARRYLVDGIPFAVGLLVRAAWQRVRGRAALAQRLR